MDSDLLTLCAVGRSGGVEEVNLSGGRLLSDIALSHLEQNLWCVCMRVWAWAFLLHMRAGRGCLRLIKVNLSCKVSFVDTLLCNQYTSCCLPVPAIFHLDV